jgi:hypothetical protein
MRRVNLRGAVAALAGTALVLSAGPGWGQPPQVNQNDRLQESLNGIVRMLDEGPVKIRECQTINASGSYVLTRNLQATGDCLLVNTNDVSIDLNGFTISGNGPGNGISDGESERTNIAVRNGTVTGFGNRGVNLFHTTAAIVEAVTARANGGTGIAAGFGSAVTGNSAQANGAGIATWWGSTVAGNTALLNTEWGITAGVGSTVTGNTAQANGGDGIQVFCPSNVIGNTAMENEVNVNLSGTGCNNSNNVAP